MIKVARGAEARAPQLEVVFVGARGAGKSLLVQRVLTAGLPHAEQQHHQQQHQQQDASGASAVAVSAADATSTATASTAGGVGVDMYSLTHGAGAARRALCVWDVAGHERARPLAQQVLPRARVAVLCYDATREDSFAALLFWRNEVLRLCPEARVIVVATHADAQDRAAVPVAAGEAQAREWHAPHLPVAATTGHGVAAVLDAICADPAAGAPA